jgi:hypothetical protein
MSGCPRGAGCGTFALTALSFQPDQEAEGKSDGEIEPWFRHQSSNLSSTFTRLRDIIGEKPDRYL